MLVSGTNGNKGRINEINGVFVGSIDGELKVHERREGFVNWLLIMTRGHGGEAPSSRGWLI